MASGERPLRGLRQLPQASLYPEALLIHRYGKEVSPTNQGRPHSWHPQRMPRDHIRPLGGHRMGEMN